MDTPVTVPTVDALNVLLQQRDHAAILAATEAVQGATHAAILKLFRAESLRQLERLDDALLVVDEALQLRPHDNWGQAIRFELLLKLGRVDDAFDGLRHHVLHGNPEAETLKATLVDRAVSLGRFDLAGEVNEARAVIQASRPRARHAVAIQCFNKPDTLEQVFRHLLACEGTRAFGLVILQDSAVGSPKQDRYQADTEAVQALIGQWLPRLLQAFESVELLQNPRNLGTAPSCRHLLDRVSERFDGVLFIEDDCLLAPDALAWTQHLLQHHIHPSGCWFGTCESIFFDARERTVAPEVLARLSRYAELDEAHSAYLTLNFVPSTCFITTAQIWRLCAGVRSFTRGPESLSKFVAGTPHRTAAPVLPRAADVGMLHDNGYSVAQLGKGNVKEIKNTYLLSRRFDPAAARRYPRHEGTLFAATVKFDPAALDALATWGALA